MVCDRLGRLARIFPAESGVVHAPTSEALRTYMHSPPHLPGNPYWQIRLQEFKSTSARAMKEAS